MVVVVLCCWGFSEAAPDGAVALAPPDVVDVLVVGYLQTLWGEVVSIRDLCGKMRKAVIMSL